MTEGEAGETPKKTVKKKERVPTAEPTQEEIGALAEHVQGLRQRYPATAGAVDRLLGRDRKDSDKTKDK